MQLEPLLLDPVTDLALLRSGTPADPATLTAAVPNWKAGDTIPLGAGRSLRVVEVREGVLVVAAE